MSSSAPGLGRRSPAEARAAGAKVVATGRSDFPNTMDISLVFPGVFRGLLDSRARNIRLRTLLYAARALADAGLVIDNDQGKRYDRFRDRIMFPIRNVKGECIGFGGRVLGDGMPKYLNSPETPVFSKGRELYGLFEARTSLREHGYALVTEGYMDVVALAQLGFPNAVATLGTACTTDHVQKLFRFTDSVVFSFDGDSAGRRAARKALDGAIPFATDVRSVKFLFLPAEHDPDSFIREFGKEAFARYVSEATPLSRFLIDAAREGCDLNSIEGRSHFASNAAPLWSALPEGALKRQLLSEIADMVQLSSRELTDVWQTAAAARRPPQAAKRNDGMRNDASSERYNNDSTQGNKYAVYKQKIPPKQAYSSNGKLRTPAKTAPAGRADHAARILLSDPALWDSLSHDDHAMLCEPTTPAGQLLVWFEAQMNEHGVQPWGALREGLREHELESMALRLMAETESKPVTNSQTKDQAIETQQELRALLDRMHIDRLKTLEAQTIEAAKADPTQLQRYKEIHARRKQLTESLASMGDK